MPEVPRTLGARFRAPERISGHPSPVPHPNRAPQLPRCLHAYAKARPAALKSNAEMAIQAAADMRALTVNL
jgi:hypothetical protein